MTLSFKNVSLDFPSAYKPVLEELNLEIHPHEFVVLLGSNGSGKSSLLKLLDSTLSPSKGQIKTSFRRKSFLTQNPKESLFFELTILENCCLNDLKYETASFRGDVTQEKSFYQNYLKKFHPQLPHNMSVPVAHLSGGECQALALALALKHKPDVLFLDEHTSALDPKTAARVMSLTENAVGESKITTLMTTHSLPYALAYGTRLIALKEGKIVLDVTDAQKRALTSRDLMKIY